MHMVKSGLVATAFLIVTLSGCVTTGTQGGGGYSSQAVSSPDAAGYEVNKGKAFAAKKELVIGGFKVAFVNSIKGSNTTRGSFLGGGGQGRASARAVLQGVPVSLMQEITDAVYEDFKRQLAAQGYTVNPFSSISGHPAFQAINTQDSPLASSEPMPAMQADALIFAPTGQKLRLMAAQGAGLQGYGWSSPEAGFSKVAVEAGVPVIDVHYVVNFATFGGHSSRTTTSIAVDQSVSVVNGSQVYITSGYGGTFSSDQGNIRLKHPIASSVQFSSIEREAKSGAEQVGNALAKGLVVLMGGGTRESNTYHYRADPEKYREAALDALMMSNQGLIGRMVTLR